MLHFSAEGHFEEESGLATVGLHRPTAIAVDVSEHIHVTSMVMPVMTSRQPLPSVGRISRHFTDPSFLAAATQRDMSARPFLAPKETVVRAVRGADGSVVVFYPWDKRVHVYRDSVLIGVAVGCMPESLLDAFREQRRTTGAMAQAGFVTTRGAWTDADGKVWIAANGADTTAMISVFSRQGEPERVYQIDLKNGNDREHWLRNALFADSATLYTWSSISGQLNIEYQ